MNDIKMIPLENDKRFVNPNLEEKLFRENQMYKKVSALQSSDAGNDQRIYIGAFGAIHTGKSNEKIKLTEDEIRKFNINPKYGMGHFLANDFKYFSILFLNLYDETLLDSKHIELDPKN